MFEYYVLCVFLLQVIIALKAPDTETQLCVLITLFWFISIPTIVIIMVIDYFNWQIEIEKSNKLIEFRRPNDNWPGFAITVFKYELQIFKVRN